MVFANNNILQIPTEFGIHILIEHIPPPPPTPSAYMCRKGFIKIEIILIQW